MSEHRVQFHNGLSMPALGYGTYKVSSADTIYAAVQAGFRHFDCAPVYGNEAVVGAGLARAIADGLVARSDLFITTKIWNTHHRPADAQAQFSASLAALGVDYVDLLLVHWPVAWRKASDGGLFPAPANEGEGYPRDFEAEGAGTSAAGCASAGFVSLWRCMEGFVASDTARSLGLSNFTAAEAAQVVATAAQSVFPVTNQVESHPHWGQHQLQRDLAALSPPITLTAHSPLDYRKPDAHDPAPVQRPDLKQLPAAVAAAARAGVSVPQVLIRWHLQLGRAVIPRTVSHIEENFAVGNDDIFTLSAEEMEGISAAQPQVRGSNPYTFKGPEIQPFWRD